jgi:hypothetical protein
VEGHGEVGVQVMEKMERVLGLEDPDTRTSMGNMASTFPKSRTMEVGGGDVREIDDVRTVWQRQNDGWT